MSDATAAQYLSDISKFRLFANNADDLTKVSALTYLEYSEYLHATYSPATVRRKLASLSSFCSFMVRLGYMKVNPMAAIKKPRVSANVSSKVLSQSQVFRLIDRCEDLRNRCLLKTLYSLGLRISECVGLKWHNFHVVNLNKVTVSIFGKGYKWREVIIPASVWNELLTLRQTQHHSNDNDFVFQSYSNRHRKQSGKQLDKDNASKVVKTCAVEAGLTDDVSAHWLRHCCASHSLANGAEISLVRDSLGHSNVAITNVYLTSNPDDCASLYIKV
ncbi:xerD, integrase/recombinase XerD [Nostoc flagelliforme CCNUN1]|uniref:XerD, integrase/recombinase XerD n=2 Tax=Nostoc flagelliforme TaxID=1306274 RepID=A0A2K8T765_9NOSO|nr:xerD, integrase/recombinase XerD [Nostoc flagelliforme CCNUN1]